MKSQIDTAKPFCSAWVVFSGKTDISWLKILKRGFRHCFVLLNDGRRWISIDPLASFTDIHIYHDIYVDYDLPKALQTNGYKVLQAHIEHGHKRPAPVMVFTCVESIKRILGIHHRLIFTPWQLYQYLDPAP